MFGRHCEGCGRSLVIGRYVDGFNVCSRCVKVQKKTGGSMAELVAKNVAVVAEVTAWRRFRGRISDALLVLAIAAGCYVYYWKPEWIRLSAQVPVTLRVQDVTAGRSNLLEIRNDFPEALKNVVLIVTNRQGFPRLGKNIGEFEPGQTKTLSTSDSEIKWIVERGDRSMVERGDKITVSCEPFLQITFTAEEIGVK